MLETPFLLALACLAVGVIGTLVQHREKNLPPGPTRIPLLGNAWHVPVEKSWMYFHSLCQKYGPMVMLKALDNDILVLDNAEDIQELLVKRSNNYSSRKQLIYAGKYRSGNKRLVLLPYGPLLKKYRAAVHTMMNPKAVGAYERLQERGSMVLLQSILNDPSKAYINIKRFTAETLFTLIYGKGFGSEEDLRTVLHILETFIQDMHPFAHMVDRMPILDWLPDFLAPWRDEARKKGEYEHKFYSRLLKDVKARMDSGAHVQCFAANLWENVEQLGLDEDSLAYVAGSAFEAGTDNTAGVMLWFLVAMMHYPAVLKRARAELDEVLGANGDTAPCYHHLDQLPYCLALVKEVLRWMPVAPLSAPHYSLKDDVYKGFRIGAGTTVIPNIWAIHHDATLFSDPFEFNPERFLMAKEDIRPESSLNEGHSAFGFGRRVCPGQHFAAKSVWVGMVRLMWAFEINPPMDVNKKPILPDVGACRSGLTAEPAHFDVVLTPRSERHIQTIQRDS
ncbi:cytochrome P450 monooxygenase [Fomitopsis serialis]|uniref:cytochrome P450 monooxygenase n=1 Tax=Fomitopsis serialis TaxID=139415 RepID=UPI0020087AC1|nr:cytochrome P450 monooxygenase [Neoantrodia serialis]KAH9914736.1 cytochrome P450 monooxygenase [Neoantrodia serialis]